MKTLIILRHGKSSWDEPMQRDIDRPLITRGKKRTQLIADYLKRHNIIPQLIISSPAIRAYDTAKIAALTLELNIEDIQIDESLYFVSVEKYFEALYAAPDKCNVLMIVGHNPMITDFCNSFLEQHIDNLPTSGLCVVSFNTDVWNEVPRSNHTVDHLVFPKKLNNNEEFTEEEK